MIFDSHIHINTNTGLGIGIENNNPNELLEFKNLIQHKKLGVLANAASPSEYDELANINGIFISFGIHPWSVNEFCEENRYLNRFDQFKMEELIQKKVTELEGYFKRANAVGEIGMDSVWCDCDLALQRAFFKEQLNMAEKLGKPVVLHTKGKEEEIAEILNEYSIKKLVHWYSCEEHLNSFMKQDCYFTIGPNYKISTAVKNVISTVKLDRLLVETDGISAVEWASGRKINAENIPSVLKETISYIAKAKNEEVAFVEEKIQENFQRFLSINI